MPSLPSFSYSSIICRSILLLHLSTFLLVRSNPAIDPVSEISGHESNLTADGVGMETQYASCTITTDNIVANARATVSKILKGACDAKTVEEKFEKLEKNLTGELEEIKGILYAILNKETSSDILNVTSRSVVDRKFLISYGLHPEDEGENYISVDNIESPRQAEIRELNNTVHETWMTDGLMKIFTYYWIVENFQEKVEDWKRTRSIRSPTFYIGEGGYAMYLRATSQFFPDGTTFVGVGLTEGRHDSSLEWPFGLRIRLEILDQSPEQQRREDRKSKIWDPTSLCNEVFWGQPTLIQDQSDNPVCVGMSLARETIMAKLSWPLPSFRRNENSRYFWRGSLMVKLTVFM